jgi:hypothetical protein
MARGALGETVGARAALESYLAQASRKSRFWEAAQAQVAGREG